MTTLTLTCLLLGDHPDKNFEVQVPKNMTISNLKRTLQSDANLSDTFEDVPPKDIEVWKVEISTTKKGCKFETLVTLCDIPAPCTDIEKGLGGVLLRQGNSKITEYFSSRPPDDEINIIVKCPSGK
ncbi:11500_t:CDS:1 [Paraglomus brasilianum]|uniref:11500_t:CDS:1 n=1 Tax=Paraglomus brasilianum TaxID=144538 RepID=A0A9N9DBV6_9GLOM|nr:11500_t:CDS:1 [Paraglomus brasilianum]